jgi:hypothetical protein
VIYFIFLPSTRMIAITRPPLSENHAFRGPAAFPAAYQASSPGRVYAGRRSRVSPHNVPPSLTVFDTVSPYRGFFHHEKPWTRASRVFHRENRHSSCKTVDTGPSRVFHRETRSFIMKASFMVKNR